MLELPHPLFADAVNIHRRLGRMHLLKEEHGSPGKDHHGDAQGHQSPEDFQGNRAVDLHRHGMFFFAVLDGEDQDQQRHQ